MNGLVKPARALISVTDKTGVASLARALVDHGVELVSTGGTARALRDAGLPVTEVADLTGFPEMMDGRVKTLHPAVHGGLLADRDRPAHAQAMAAHGIAAIDLLVVNLYRFSATASSGADRATVVENIDIGGPAMIRSAAKNYAHVAVLTNPADYTALLAELAEHGGTTLELRRALAKRAFAATAAYDAAIAGWFTREQGDQFPPTLALAFERVDTLRYGENPHQAAAVYATPGAPPGIPQARQLQGKPLSYNNINDADAALEMIAHLGSARPACAIIKHANPCGVALGHTLAGAYADALACDPVSAFGGIVALNGTLDADTAEAVTAIFTEVVIAPAATPEAIAIFARKPNLRLLLAPLPDPAAPGMVYRSITGGLLAQTRDKAILSPADMRVVTRRQPTAQERADLLLAWTVAKMVKSNAIVFVKDGVTAAIGAGQMSRVDSTRIAARKAEDAAKAAGWPEPRTVGSAVASDAFFPFPDGPLAAADAGAAAIIQPGGSIRDAAVIAACDERGLAMVFTGVRHFRH